MAQNENERSQLCKKCLKRFDKMQKHAPTYNSLQILFGEVFGGGEKITAQELIADAASAGISIADLVIMEASINAHPSYLQGLPMPGENKAYDKLVKVDKGFALIQKYMDFWG